MKISTPLLFLASIKRICQDKEGESMKLPRQCYNLIEDYHFLDLRNIDEEFKYLEPILKSWQEDKHLLSFFDNIKEEYVFLQKFATANEDGSPKIIITHKSLFPFLQKVLKATKDLDFPFTFYEFENKDILFYRFKYDRNTKDIFLYKIKVALRRTNYNKRIHKDFDFSTNDSFAFSKVWQKESFIIKESNECVFKVSETSKFFKSTDITRLFNNHLLKTYFLNKIDTPIIKDLKNLANISLYHKPLEYFKVDFNILKSSHTIQDLIENIVGEKIPFNLNKFDMFLALSFALSLKFIEENQRNKIYQYLVKKENLPHIKYIEYIKIIHKRKKFYCLNVLYPYLVDKLNIEQEINTDDEEKIKEIALYENELKNLTEDYIKLCYETKTLVNLNINSIKRLKTEHDLLVKKLEQIKISKNKKLNIHKDFKSLTLPKNFELIEKEGRLYLQGLKQHNCVFTRRDIINKGLVAIYNLNYQGADYTLEIKRIKRDNHQSLCMGEFKGIYNKNPKTEVISYVKAILEKFNNQGGMYGKA